MDTDPKNDRVETSIEQYLHSIADLFPEIDLLALERSPLTAKLDEHRHVILFTKDGQRLNDRFPTNLAIVHSLGEEFRADPVRNTIYVDVYRLIQTGLIGAMSLAHEVGHLTNLKSRDQAARVISLAASQKSKPLNTRLSFLAEIDIYNRIVDREIGAWLGGEPFLSYIDAPAMAYRVLQEYGVGSHMWSRLSHLHHRTKMAERDREYYKEVQDDFEVQFYHPRTAVLTSARFSELNKILNSLDPRTQWQRYERIITRLKLSERPDSE